MNKIYALLDIDTLKKYNLSIKDFCLAANKLNSPILQYRDKNSDIENKIKNLQEIKKYWHKTLIINDDLDLLPFADGIHIGQEDLENLSEKLKLSKKQIIEYIKEKNKLVGLSTHNKEEILKANELPLDYIGLGAYRATQTKDTDNILGDKITKLIKYSKHPVAVIGGITLNDEIPGATYKVIASDICKNINFI